MRLRRTAICLTVGAVVALAVPWAAHLSFWPSFAWGFCCGAGAVDRALRP